MVSHVRYYVHRYVATIEAYDTKQFLKPSVYVVPCAACRACAVHVPCAACVSMFAPPPP